MFLSNNRFNMKSYMVSSQASNITVLRVLKKYIPYFSDNMELPSFYMQRLV